MIDRPRYLHDLRILDLDRRAVFDLPLPVYKGAVGSHAYATEAVSTDGTRWPILNVYTSAWKHRQQFAALFAAD